MPSTSFHEYRKSGYVDKTQKKTSTRESIRDGLKELKQEIKNWTAEVKDGVMMDPIMAMPLPGNHPFQLFYICVVDISVIYSRGSGCPMVF